MESSTADSISLVWDDEELEVRAAVQALLNKRYLRSRALLDKSQDFILDIAPNLPDNRFRQFFRVSRGAFNMLLNLIQDYPGFNAKQAPVHQQLGIALRRFGSSMDTMQVGQMFGVGDGTVSLYTRRVCKALMQHWKEVVYWPTKEEQTKMKIRLRARPSWVVWEDCIGWFYTYILIS
jgi:hypothetical protein